MLTQKEWEKINLTVNELFKETASDKLRLHFLQNIKELISFSFSDFSISSPRGKNTYTLTDPVVLSCYDNFFESKFLSLYEKDFASLDYVNWLFSNAKSTVYRESDLIKDDLRLKSRFYQEYLLPFNLIHIAGAVICDENRFLAALTLYNTADKGDFSEKDIYILQQFLPHLQLMLSKLSPHNDTVIQRSSYILSNTFHLTPRETEIAKLIYRGLSNREIAAQLNVAEDTVKKHLYHIFQKLNLSNRTQIIKFVQDNDLTDLFC